jgi:hypothetical protein
LQCSIPSTIKFNKIAQAFRPRTIQRIKLADFISVARVRPRTSKGITAATHVHRTPTELWRFGPIPRRLVPQGTSTYLKLGSNPQPTPLRALRRPLVMGLATGSAPPRRMRLSLYQVVLRKQTAIPFCAQNQRLLHTDECFALMGQIAHFYRPCGSNLLLPPAS